MNYYDAHNHFHFDALTPHRAQLADTLARLGLGAAVVNGTNADEWPVVAALARQFSWIIPSYGIHPWDCGDRDPAWLENLRAALEAAPRAHVGEIGLDRWIVDGARPDDPRLSGMRVAPLEEQRAVFSAQLALAAELNRVASIHCTQAFGLLLEVLRTTTRPARGFLLHHFGGSAEMVKTFADLGAYFSYNLVTEQTKRAVERASFQAVPAGRLLVETDAPACAPSDPGLFSLGLASDGSVINHPVNIALAYDSLARLRGVSLAVLAAQVEENFRRLFGPG